MPEVKLSHPDKVLFPDDGITKADLAAYYAAVAEWMLPHVRDRPLNLWRWNTGIGGRLVVQQDIPKGAPDWVAAGRDAAAQGRQHRARALPGRRHAALAGQPELHHAARLDRAARPARPPRPARVRPRPRGGLGVRARARGGARGRRAAARARARAVRDDHRLQGHPRRRAAQAHARVGVGARAGGRARRRGRRGQPGHADHRVAQEQARRADPRRHRAQHLRPDRRRALRGAGAAGRARGDAAGLGGAVGPAAVRALVDAAHGAASGWRSAAIRGPTSRDHAGTLPG